MSKRRSIQILLEELEVRAVPTAVCNANSTYQGECNYFNNLIPSSDYTVQAVKSGKWSDPTVWSTGKAPATGAVVYIPQGETVTVDGQEAGALRAVVVNGDLTFAPSTTTSLTVDTLLVGTEINGVPVGELDVGTPSAPVTGSATLTFANDAALATGIFSGDYNLLERGLVSMGTVNLVGSQVTPYVNTTGIAANTTTLVLSSTPTGWQAGDTLLIPGTSATANQDEQIAIASVSGNTVTLAHATAYSHSSPSGVVQVADEARHVVLQSQTPGPQTGGHVMFMHQDAETVQYVALLGLGRTDKSQPLANGSSTGGPGANQVGRYALHFHRDYWPSINGSDAPVLVKGCFEEGSPGWGYDNHSSNVDFEYNVAYDNFGAGFATEAGNEIGTFNGNLAVRTIGVPNGDQYVVLDSRQSINDFGFNGAGYWFQGPGCAITNDIATDNQVGFDYFNLGLVEGALGTCQFWSANTANPSGYTAMFGTLCPVDSVEVPSFSGDVVSEATLGVRIDWQMDPSMPVPQGAQTYLNNLAEWDITTGINNGYSGRITVENCNLTGGGSGTGILNNGGGYSNAVSVTNTNVSGFAVGEVMPTRAQNVTTGGTWNNTLDFEIQPQAEMLVSNSLDQFTSTTISVGTPYQLDAIPPINIQPGGDYNGPNNYFVPWQILLPTGQQLYYANQAPNYVPFPTATAGIPGAFDGLTNQQLWNTYGLAMEGALAPSNATSQYGGLVGTPNPQSTYYRLYSPLYTPNATYTLQYVVETNGVSANSVTTDPTQATLQPGWNAITRTINGHPFTFLVNYTAPPVATQFVLSGLPNPVLTSLPANFTVSATDGSGTVVTTYTGTVSFTSSDPQAVLPAPYTFTSADKGVHTFQITFNTVGTQSVTASDGTISGTASTTVKQKPAGNVLLKDTFTDANGTLLQNHTMDTGPGWQVLSGNWQIQNNAVEQTTQDFVYDKAVSDAGTSNATVSAQFSTSVVGGNTGQFGLVVRATDNYDYLAVVVSDGQLSLVEDTGGTPGYDIVTLAGPVAVSVSTSQPNNFKAVVSGTTVTVYWGGTQVLQYTSATFNQTATKFGLLSYNAANWPVVTMDNFEVDINS
jgi:hypothetical protein